MSSPDKVRPEQPASENAPETRQKQDRSTQKPGSSRPPGNTAAADGAKEVTKTSKSKAAPQPLPSDQENKSASPKAEQPTLVEKRAQNAQSPTRKLSHAPTAPGAVTAAKAPTLAQKPSPPEKKSRPQSLSSATNGETNGDNNLAVRHRATGSQHATSTTPSGAAPPASTPTVTLSPMVSTHSTSTAPPSAATMEFVEPVQIQLSQVAALEEHRRHHQHNHATGSTGETSERGPRPKLQPPTEPSLNPPPLKRTSVLPASGRPASFHGNSTNAGSTAAKTTTAETAVTARASHFTSTTKAPTFATASTKATRSSSTGTTGRIPAASAAPSTGKPTVRAHTNTPPAASTAALSSPLELSKRSRANTVKVEEALYRCMNPAVDDPPTTEEQELYAMVRVVRMSPIGFLFVAHPEVIVSNRAAVIIARNLAVGDEASTYRVTKVLKPGTLGRSYHAVSTAATMESPTSKSSGLPDTFDERRLGNLSAPRPQPMEVVLKVVSCVLRRSSVQKLMADVRKIININSENVARVADVLRDDHYNVVVCSEYHPRGNLAPFAGKFKTIEETRLMKSIMLDIAIGLYDLHSVKIAHHNVRLENVLQKDNHQFCIADAGFSALFATESPEALLFNGELAALPPEVFDPQGMYADDEWEGEAFTHLEKVDVWGFGTLMYQLAYGTSPIAISDLSSLDAYKEIVSAAVKFPERPEWPFAALMNNAIERCMDKDPRRRPTMFQLLNSHEFFSGDFAQRHRATARLQSDANNSSGGPAPTLRTPSSFTLNIGPNLTARTSSTSSAGSAVPQNIVGYIVDEIVSRSAETETLRVHTRADPSREFAFKVTQRSLQARLKTSHLPSAVLRQLAFSRKVAHPHLVANVELIDGELSGLFVVQEFLRGGPLFEIPPITRPKGESGPTMKTLLGEVLLALVHLHDNDVPHLSLSPSNIFYTEDRMHFKVVDYGCIWRTVEEMVDRHNNTACFDIPTRIVSEDPMSGTRVDVFTMGLLAASAEPELFHTIWNQYRRVPPTREPLSVERVVRTLKKKAKTLPAELVDFATVALTQDVSARDLLKHPYLSGAVPKEVPIKRVRLSQADLDEAVKLNAEAQVENRLLNTLGYDPFQESLAASNYSFDMADTAEEVKAVVVIIKGRKIKCAKCGAEMVHALYLCLTCKNYLCCGKCAIDNDHKPGHQLEVYIMYKLEYLKNGTTKVSLVHPFAIKKVHALEVIEARENLPAGALTGRYVAQRALERSMRSVAPAQLAHNSGLFQGVTEVQSEIDSDAGSESTNFMASAASSVIHVPHTTATTAGSRASTNCTRLKSLNSTSAFGAQLGSSMDGMSPVSTGLVPSAPPKNSLLIMVKNSNLNSTSTTNVNNGAAYSGNGGSEVKKLTLPKEADINDESPEEELEKCREKRSRELLLFNFAMTEVPRDVYDPPLLHLEVLDLKENLLTSLPDELSFLKNLRKLTVSYNELTELPPGLGNLPVLEEIDASHNLLTALPGTFICLSSLRSIALDYNNFTEVPRCLLDIYGSVSPDTSHALMPSCETTITHSVKTLSLVPPGSSTAQLLLPGVPNMERRHTSESVQGWSPRLNAIFMVANDNLTTFPNPELLARFAKLQLCLDNEPSLFQFYHAQQLEAALPDVTVNWNKNYPDEIIPHLYCGSLRTTQSQMVYKKLDIEYVLTVGRGLQPMKPENGQQKTVIVDDIPGADIRCSFEESVAFIDESQKRGKGCLVHCFAGLSRSATTVIAYLMMRKGMRLDEAYLVTKKGRPAILPNAGFFSQLLLLDKELFPNATRSLDIESLGRPE